MDDRTMITTDTADTMIGTAGRMTDTQATEVGPLAQYGVAECAVAGGFSLLSTRWESTELIRCRGEGTNVFLAARESVCTERSLPGSPPRQGRRTRWDSMPEDRFSNHYDDRRWLESDDTTKSSHERDTAHYTSRVASRAPALQTSRDSLGFVCLHVKAPQYLPPPLPVLVEVAEELHVLALTVRASAALALYLNYSSWTTSPATRMAPPFGFAQVKTDLRFPKIPVSIFPSCLLLCL
ncbi:hypothetical protein GQ600_25108 [Phytophthora cactorum]|nr:hypothetical protein GQ600_25108 [Phytophthora cactorum]